MSDDRARRTAAYRAATKVLSAADPTLAGGLAALAAAAETVRGPDGIDLTASVDTYGDGVVGELERRVAALLGLPAAVFFPTGTMAQQVALRC